MDNSDTLNKNKGAFACVDDVNYLQHGLSKREYFAGLAMQGICGDGIAGPHHIAEQTAIQSVRYADALLKELDK